MGLDGMTDQERGDDQRPMAIFGDTLRQARAYKGVTLKEAEQATRINRHHLAALEDEQFGALPPPIYQRGIVRNYAAYLDLDAAKLLTMFEEAHGQPSESKVIPAVKPLDMPSHWAPNFAIIAFMVVMVAIVFSWLYSAYFAPTSAAPTATSAVATVTPYPTSASQMPARDAEGATPATTAEAKETATTDSAEADESPSPTRTPKPTKTPVPPTPTDEPEPDVAVQEQPAALAPVPEPTPIPEQAPVVQAEPSGATFWVDISALDVGIQVTVYADGALAYDGWLEPGQSTGPLYATIMEVATTNANQTWFVNDLGEGFKMGLDEGPGVFTLAR